MSKSQRQHLLAKILEEQSVSSQAKLVDLLKAEGIDVTQATLSRDLEELGLPEVIGTVAGDDTVLLVAASNTTGEAVSEKLKDLAGIEPQSASEKK